MKRVRIDGKLTNMMETHILYGGNADGVNTKPTDVMLVEIRCACGKQIEQKVGALRVHFKQCPKAKYVPEEYR